jgi:hypothetical protein
MTKKEYLRILILLSQMEGYIAGKIGTHTLPDYMSEELSEICEILSNHIKGTS